MTEDRTRSAFRMYSLHCTKKLLDRIKPTIVNEQTLLPVLMPLASVSTLSARFAGELAAVLARHGVKRAFIEREMAAMADVAFTKMANRSVVGIMNEFAFLAERYREYLEATDLMILSMRLANTPCSPINYNSPARLIKEVLSDAVR